MRRRLPPALAALALLALVCGLFVFPSVGLSDAGFTNSVSVGGNIFNTDALNPPTGLTAAGGTSVGTISLNWTATIDTYATGYHVLRATVSGGPYSQIAQITPRTTVTYGDSGLTAGTRYYYVVRAYYQSWESANSSEVNALPTTSGTFGASSDSWVQSDKLTQNNGTGTTATVDGNSTKTKRMLVQFNISSIPANSVIQSATLTVCFPAAPSAGAQGRTHQLHLVTAAWTETGVTWSNQPSSSATTTDSLTVPSTAQCMTLTVTGDVQAWMSGTNNNGWRLNDSDESSAVGSAANYGTRENGTAGDRPNLSITYSPP